MANASPHRKQNDPREFRNKKKDTGQDNDDGAQEQKQKKILLRVVRRKRFASVNRTGT